MRAVLQRRRAWFAVRDLPRRARDGSVVCVVEDPQAIAAFERTRDFQGRYHVLQGRPQPARGRSDPTSSRVEELVVAHRAREGITEVVLCTNPNLEGEATAMYLARRLSGLRVRVTRLASGLPVGGDLEYADEMTLGRALEGRRELLG